MTLVSLPGSVKSSPFMRFFIAAPVLNSAPYGTRTPGVKNRRGFFKIIFIFAGMKNSVAYLKLMIIGIIVAGVLVLMQRYNESCAKAESVKYTKTAQFGAKQQIPFSDDRDEGPQLTVSSSSLPSAISIEVGRETLCLFEIIFEDEIEFWDYQQSVPITLTKFFRTLLEVIISPNAP